MKRSLAEEIEIMEMQCRQSYEQWDNIFTNGCQDPFWEDGVNLNLVRNHIIYYQNRITDLCEENGYFKPEICFREPPLKVDQHYMAKKAEIEQAACNNLQDIEQNKNYLKLLAFESKLSDEQRKSVSYSAVLGYVNHLKTAILNKDHVAMRRYSNGLWVIDSIVQCLERIEKIIDTAK